MDYKLVKSRFRNTIEWKDDDKQFADLAIASVGIIVGFSVAESKEALRRVQVRSHLPDSYPLVAVLRDSLDKTNDVPTDISMMSPDEIELIRQKINMRIDQLNLALIEYNKLEEITRNESVRNNGGS